MKGKDSFILYSDLIHVVRKMKKDDAGELFLHILKYVNDENPATENIIVDLTFEPIKQNLKRDLKKWIVYIEKQRSNGEKGGRPKEPKITQPFLKEPKKAEPVTVTDTVTDSVIVTVKKEHIPKKSKKILFDACEIFDKVKFKETFPEWTKLKMAHYYDAALRYSNEGNRYVDWIAAVRSWAKKDEVSGKVKFSGNAIAPSIYKAI